MSSASSNQSVVRDGADYEEVYSSSHKDQESPGEEQPIRSVVGADGLRGFIMLPEWMVHNFTSTIKEKHFNTLKG